jgi:hypothetical protein
MPKQYEAIRDRLVKEGVPLKQAKTRAARIYNAKRKRGQPPVTRYHGATMARRGIR